MVSTYVNFLKRKVILFRGYSRVVPKAGVCGLDISNRIKRGNITGLTSYPWTALLVYRIAGDSSDSFECGGSLISDRYVLTAAHCLSGLEDGYRLDRIRLGKWDLLSDSDCIMHMGGEVECNDPPVDVGVEKIIIHERFNYNTTENDIALIKLNQTIKFTDIVQPVCLPRDNFSKNMNTSEMTFTMIGWGATEHANVTDYIGSRYKLHIPQKGVNQTDCNNVYDEIFTSQLCAKGEKDATRCSGDSGSGLVSAVEGYYYVFGIASYIYRCGYSGVPGVYTRVTSFLDWIEDKIDDNA